MLPLVEIPQIVQHYAPWFEAVFSAEALVQFQRYLSGLIISENKTVNGICRNRSICSRSISGCVSGDNVVIAPICGDP